MGILSSSIWDDNAYLTSDCSSREKVVFVSFFFLFFFLSRFWKVPFLLTNLCRGLLKESLDLRSSNSSLTISFSKAFSLSLGFYESLPHFVFRCDSYLLSFRNSGFSSIVTNWSILSSVAGRGIIFSGFYNCY